MVKEPPLNIHIDSTTKDERLPEFDETIIHCGKESEVGYGMAGGGMGVYTYCRVCGRVTSKSVDPE